MRRSLLVFLGLLLLISGCLDFNFGERKEDKPGVAFTGIVGGKGTQVGFLPNTPPYNKDSPSLSKIDGPFGVAIKFFNYNAEPVTIDRFTVGSTGIYDGFSNFDDESITLEGALIRETGRGPPQFLGPGTEFTYTGQASKQRDGSLHYGDFQFQNIDRGAGTSFFVDMLIQDYVSKSSFQFCAFDVGATISLGACPLMETIAGSQLGFSHRYDPVVVASVVKTLSSLRDGVRITLDIFIEDRSEKQTRLTSGSAFERGQIVLQDSYAQFFFELESTAGRGISFLCSSDQELGASAQQKSFLTAALRDGKARIRCVGYDSLFEERKDYQYQTTLRYPYQQTVSTGHISIEPDVRRSLS